jgi:hypothetical protein
MTSLIIFAIDLKRCKNPNHKEHVANFIKKSAKGRVSRTIIMVESNDWAIAARKSCIEYDGMLSGLQLCRRFSTG